MSTPPRSPARIFFRFNLLFILAVFIVGFRPEGFRSEVKDTDLASHNGQKISFKGRICEEADVGISNRRLTVCAAGRVLVTTNLYPAHDYGDFLHISGQLQTPPEIDGFDYESYLARYDIYSVMYYPKIETADGVLSGPERLYLSLVYFKQEIKALIDRNLPEPEAGLADALLLGYRRSVSREDLDMFARAGLSHMIAISGSHITILSALILNFWLALGLNRRRALPLVFIFLALYPLITGLAASAVRSSVMGGLAFLAIYYGRLSSLIRTLVFAAALMLAFNPRLLRDDIGFQLSFLALLGIIYLYPWGERWTDKRLARSRLKYKSKNFLKNILNTANLTLVSQIIILPVALINFGQLSLIAPLANILVLWTFPLLLASLIFGVVASALVPPLGVFFFLPAYLLLKFIFVLSAWLAAPDWAAVAVANFNWQGGLVYYLLLFIVLKLIRKRKDGDNLTKITN